MNNALKANSVQFNGKGGEYFGIWIVNILLSVVTLGIYSAWAKVRTKRYFYGNTVIDGDNFEYHATPWQILKGRIVALFVVLLLALTMNIVPVIGGVLLLVFYLMMPWLLWSNARFDAAMTSFRNVHFRFVGTLGGIYRTLLGRGLVATVAIVAAMMVFAILTQIIPSLTIVYVIGVVLVCVMANAWVMAGMIHYTVNGQRYGDYQFKGDIQTRFFIKLYLKAVGLGLLSLIVFLAVTFYLFFGGSLLTRLVSGDSFAILELMHSTALLVMVWLAAMITSVAISAYVHTRSRNYAFTQTALYHQPELNQISDADKKEEPKECDLSPVHSFALRSDLPVWGYTWLLISNFLLVIFSLGLARPWTLIRHSRYLAEYTSVLGDMSMLAAVGDNSDVRSAIGDEIAEAYDLGFGLG
ncbi:DUF898 domain-containing protein [Vibrio sp. SM6]|uniref:DUF898 domain-containing protein n=1 Tax=Vibrio agarilyticus TaxID=2726741 RepID=A0A7X8TRS4_9VIBR|nr:YjgN family protein [Vibrio agarilyticus]NLS13589.1 DUF898 domain-containing protein [Vibrio agarilyticus]